MHAAHLIRNEFRFERAGRNSAECRKQGRDGKAEPIERVVTAPTLWADQGEITVNSVEVMVDAFGPVTECAPFLTQPVGPTFS